MNSNDYTELAKYTASWANSIRLGNAEIVAETLERVSVRCMEFASVPDEWERCAAKNAEQKKSKLTLPAPKWKWLADFFSRGKQPTV